MNLEIKKRLNKKTVPLWLAVTLPIAVALGTFSGRIYLADVEQRNQAIEEIRDSINVFIEYAGRYTSSILEGREDVSKKREDLLDNIRIQYATLENTPLSFSQGGKIALARYQEELISMVKILDRNHDGSSLREFYVRFQELALAQKQLMREIE